MILEEERLAEFFVHPTRWLPPGCTSEGVLFAPHHYDMSPRRFIMPDGSCSGKTWWVDGWCVTEAAAVETCRWVGGCPMYKITQEGE